MVSHSVVIYIYGIPLMIIFDHTGEIYLAKIDGGNLFIKKLDPQYSKNVMESGKIPWVT